MERKTLEQAAKDSTVRALYLTPRGRQVPPLTDAEIIKLRQLLVDAETIAESCPVARRVLSKR